MAIRKRFELSLKEGRLVTKEAVKKNPDEKDLNRERFLRGLGLVSELGFIISFPLVGGVFLGIWLDRRYGSSPKMTLSLIFLGLIIAFANLFVITSEFSKKK